MSNVGSIQSRLRNPIWLGFTWFLFFGSACASDDCNITLDISIDVACGHPVSSTAQLLLKIDLCNNCPGNEPTKGVRFDGYHVCWLLITSDGKYSEKIVSEEDVNLNAPAFLKWNEEFQQTIVVRMPKNEGRFRLTVAPRFSSPRNFKTSDFASVEITHSPERLVYLTIMVLLLGMGIGLGVVLGLRKRIQFRLSSCVGVSIVTAVLIYINSRETYINSCWSSGRKYYFCTGYPGWPWPIQSIILSQYYWKMLVGDALIFVGILFAVAIFMELLFRPRKSLKSLTSAESV